MRVYLALAALIVAGCGNKEVVPYLGKWDGRFEVESIEHPTAIPPQRHDMRGYLQVYRSGDTFKLHLEGEQLVVDGEGTWNLENEQLQLSFSDLQFDDAGGSLKRDPNKAFIPIEDIKRGYDRPLTLRLTPDKRRLEGLTTSFGSVIGKHVFTR